MVIATEIAGIVRQEYLDYHGVADLGAPEVQAVIAAQGGTIATSYSRAIAIGAVLSSELVDQLPAKDERVRALYKYHVYGVTAGRLDRAVTIIAAALERAGHRALAIPASPVAIDRLQLAGVFSHKLAARLAGLGWIGKSCMLITPEHGPRAVWAPVLTDARLAPTGTPYPSRCGNCRACVESCPARAYTGREFDPAEPRESRYDAVACWNYVESLPAAGPESRTCGLCLQACPRGRRRH